MVLFRAMLLLWQQRLGQGDGDLATSDRRSIREQSRLPMTGGGGRDAADELDGPI